MSTEQNQEAPVTPEVTEGEGSTNISLSKAEYDQLIADRASFGSLKREFKDLKKSLEKPVETPTKETKTDEHGLLQKGYLRMAGISSEDEVEFALQIAKKWDMPVDKLVDDEDFKLKLDKLRTQKSNELATSNIKGSPGQSGAKNTPDYWIAKGAPPSRDDVPDRKARAKIARAMMAATKSNKQFYND